MEARRPVEWVEHDRKQYWPREVRKASDVVSEARLALQRCELTISGEDNRSCYDERKALQRAKKRLEACDEKVRSVRQWTPKIRKEVEEFEVQVAKLKQYLESDFGQAPAALSRMADALDRYVQQGSGGGTAAPPSLPRGAPESP
jgi:chromosome segregation ATPase